MLGVKHFAILSVPHTLPDFNFFEKSFIPCVFKFTGHTVLSIKNIFVKLQKLSN